MRSVIAQFDIKYLSGVPVLGGGLLRLHDFKENFLVVSSKTKYGC